MESDGTLQVTEKIKKTAKEAGGGPVSEVIIGLGYTFVRIGKSCGLAYTHRESLGAGCEAFHKAGKLCGKEADELLSWIAGGSPIASGIGLAVANAMLKPPDELLGTDLLGHLGIQPGEKVVTVGRFKPMEPKLESLGARLEVIEWGDPPGQLGDCDIALITGTSIINNTIEELLQTVGNAREVVILGPSTPYAPDAFAGTPVTCLAGSAVNDPERVRQVTCEGGGTPAMGKALAKWVKIL